MSRIDTKCEMSAQGRPVTVWDESPTVSFPACCSKKNANEYLSFLIALHNIHPVRSLSEAQKQPYHSQTNPCGYHEAVFDSNKDIKLPQWGNMIRFSDVDIVMFYLCETPFRLLGNRVDFTKERHIRPDRPSVGSQKILYIANGILWLPVYNGCQILKGGDPRICLDMVDHPCRCRYSRHEIIIGVAICDPSLVRSTDIVCQYDQADHIGCLCLVMEPWEPCIWFHEKGWELIIPMELDEWRADIHPRCEGSTGYQIPDWNNNPVYEKMDPLRIEKIARPYTATEQAHAGMYNLTLQAWHPRNATGSYCNWGSLSRFRPEPNLNFRVFPGCPRESRRARVSDQSSHRNGRNSSAHDSETSRVHEIPSSPIRNIDQAPPLLVKQSSIRSATVTSAQEEEDQYRNARHAGSEQSLLTQTGDLTPAESTSSIENGAAVVDAGIRSCNSTAAKIAPRRTRRSRRRRAHECNVPGRTTGLPKKLFIKRATPRTRLDLGALIEIPVNVHEDSKRIIEAENTKTYTRNAQALVAEAISQSTQMRLFAAEAIEREEFLAKADNWDSDRKALQSVIQQAQDMLSHVPEPDRSMLLSNMEDEIAESDLESDTDCESSA